jgi:hypothetical protein
MTAPTVVKELVERFDAFKETYLSNKYKEIELRNEFLNPLFEALGWDLFNLKGYADAYKEVIHEDAIKIGGRTKAPDYCFRAGGGQRSFFVEAKKPSVDIGEAISPAYQLRRYAWSAKLPLSILTDFEEFAVYDCRIRPDKNDKASTARVIYLNYSEYVARWDELYGLFSPEAIRKGSLEKFITSKRIKKGTAEVDKAFLSEIEGWRTELARHLALRNEGLSPRDLNFSVQRIIDRIIFLRICEDRGIEPYGKLESLQNAPNIYRRMRELFQRADDRYNSGLFHFTQEKDRSEPPDELTLDLTVEDKPLQDILGGLYYPESPYEFSVFPVEILGQVYEQFLGKVIRLTKGHQAKVEEKPEVRKAGGVYYTPSYIVDYIVRHTVGKLLIDESVESSEPYSIARSVTKSKITPTQAARLRILDPACGSGSFLLGAYQYLLDWHRDWYINNDFNKYAKGRNPKLYKSYSGDWRLTSAERKRILLNNIYGVDIDEQAVEVTKLSLLLKVLEGESGETVDNQIRLFHERALPDLGDNIKCGNSLIGPDFYNGNQLKLFDDEEQLRVNVFDWHDKKLGFGKIMARGGFDAIISNPPWGASFTEAELIYFRNKHKDIIVRMIDSFMYFLHAASKKISINACLGMILPDVILYQHDNIKLRNYILGIFRIHRILNLGNVFEKVTRPACILILELSDAKGWHLKAANFTDISKSDKPAVISENNRYIEVSQDEILALPNKLFITSSISNYLIWNKIKTIPHILLGEFVDEHGIQRGVSPDLKEAFIVNRKTAKKWNLEKQYLRKVLTGGKHLKRYIITQPDLLLIYTDRKTDFSKIPNIRAYISQFRNKITCKEVKKKKHSLYALHRSRNENIFLKDKKLLGVITEDRISVALDNTQLFATDGLYLFGVREDISIEYVIGILNSKLFVHIYRLLAMEEQRVLAQVKPTLISELPIRRIDFSDKADKQRYDRMVSLVETMLDLQKKAAEMKAGHEKTVVERQIAATDRQIDQLVYELYGLTDEEIAIVEGQS